VLTLAAVAADKGIAPQRIGVQIERRTDEGRPWRTWFAVQIDLGGGLTRRERIILYNCARHCEVNKLLNGELAFEYTLIE
jgi:hypothetical protein